MNLFNKNIIDLYVFDKNESLIAKLNTLKSNKIWYEDGYYFIGITDFAFNLDLQKFIHEEEKLTDFQLIKDKIKTTIKIKPPKSKECKLIGKTLFREQETELDKEVLFEIHNAEIIDPSLNIETTGDNVTEFDYIFKIHLDEDNNFFKLQFNI